MFCELELPAMGSTFKYKILLKNRTSKEDALIGIKNAHQEVSNFEQRYTEFKEDSFLSSINKNAGKQSVPLTIYDQLLFQKAIDYGDKTNGVFNIAFRSENRNYKDIILTENEIYLPYSDLKISLGGIGKGYAVDMAYQKLLSLGFSNFIVNGNGDIRVHSQSSALRPWHIGIKNPFDITKQIGLLPIKKGAVASSGNYIQHGHIKCKNDSLQGVTVLGTNATEADVYGTTLFSLGMKEALKLINSNNINAILIDKSGKVFNHISQEVIQ